MDEGKLSPHPVFVLRGPGSGSVVEEQRPEVLSALRPCWLWHLLMEVGVLLGSPDGAALTRICLGELAVEPAELVGPRLGLAELADDDPEGEGVPEACIEALHDVPQSPLEAASALPHPLLRGQVAVRTRAAAAAVGEAEVDDDRLVSRLEHDVLRLEVPVDDPIRMEEGDALEDPLEQLPEPLQQHQLWEASSPAQRPEHL